MDNTQNHDDVSPTADREMVISRRIDQPTALVFNAWTESKQLEKWWGPEGFTTAVHEMDVVEGGVARLVMRGPDGIDYPNKLVYSDIKAAQHLSYLQSDDSDTDNDAAAFGVTVLFDGDEHHCVVTMHTLFKTAAERDRVVREFDAMKGAEQTLERLDNFLKEFLPPH